MSRLQNQCSRREYCTRDIVEKIRKAAPGENAMAEEIVSSLKKDNYLSDRRYASAFAREKASISGWGAIKIRYALSAKGISREDIDAALEEASGEAASSRLEKVLAVKYAALKEDPQWKLKLLRFGLSRGYQYDEIAPVVDRLGRSDGD